MYSHLREEKRPLVEETVVEVVLLLQTALERGIGEGEGGTGGGGRREEGQGRREEGQGRREEGQGRREEE